MVSRHKLFESFFLFVQTAIRFWSVAGFIEVSLSQDIHFKKKPTSCMHIKMFQSFFVAYQLSLLFLHFVCLLCQLHDVNVCEQPRKQKFKKLLTLFKFVTVYLLEYPEIYSNGIVHCYRLHQFNFSWCILQPLFSIKAFKSY